MTNDHEKHRHYRTCGTDLRTAPTASAPPQLVDATRTLLPTGAEPAALISAGRRVTPAELREALLLLTVTLMRRPAHGNPPLDRRVETALSAAMEVLDHQGRSTAAHHAASLIDLHPGSPLAPIVPSSSLAYRRVNPLLHAIALDAHGENLAPARQFGFRIGTLWPRIPHELRHRLTPQPTFDEDWNTPPAPLEAIRAQAGPRMLPGLRDLQPSEAVATTVALALVGRPLSIRAASQALGLDRSAQAGIPRTWKAVGAEHGWGTYRSFVIAAADALAR